MIILRSCKVVVIVIARKKEGLHLEMFQTTPPVKPLCRLPHWHHLHNICWPDWPQLGCSLLTTDGSWSTEWIQKTVTLQWCHQDVVQETPFSCSLCLLNAFLLQLNVHLQAISERYLIIFHSLLTSFTLSWSLQFSWAFDVSTVKVMKFFPSLLSNDKLTVSPILVSDNHRILNFNHLCFYIPCRVGVEQL